MLKTGIDLVFIPRIDRVMADKELLKKLFHEDEMNPLTSEHIAGIYAAKEAFFKALNKEPEWLHIHIKKQQNNAPYISLSPELAKTIKEASLSISHEKDYAIANVILDIA